MDRSDAPPSANDMSESSSQDKWGDLARSIGAEVRDEPQEQPAANSTSSAARVAAPARRAPQEPRRPPAGWDELIGEFGIAAEAPAEPAKRPATQRPPRARSEEPSRPSRQHVEKPSDVSPPRREPVRESKAENPQRVAPAPAPPTVSPESRSGYGLPGWFPFARKREPPSAPVPEPQELPPSTGKADALPELSQTKSSESIAEEELTTEADVESGETESAAGKRRRPRRRRRGGRGKAETSEAVEKRQPRASKSNVAVESVVVDLGPAGHEVELFEDDETGDLAADADDEEGDEFDESDSGRSRSAGHRNIPSWAEAIGVVVDANLATRTERKKSVRPSGDSRGRGRGRRKKRP